MMRESANSIPPLQFGLTLFREIERKENKDHQVPLWEMLLFKFALCPRAVFRDRGSKYPIRDRVMQVQASSVEFLCRNGFDFQKSFSEGVSWLRHCDEDSSRTELMACFKPPSSEYMPSMDEQETSAVD